jgi:WD40 repeat protein/tRNA A-37 threonylcarbamoyl transferase component Bud32
MSERSIFLNALDREDPAARAAYLDEACAGKPELRRRIERLLRAHREGGSFLEETAPEQLARADLALTFLSPPREPEALGRLDHYEVLKVVGRGGTGVVLKARDTKLQRIVAIKALAPRLAASGGARQRFVREAQAAAAVRDDHVVAIYAVSDDGPVPYLVMEFISGTTLAERLQQAGALGLCEVLRLGMQIAKGLAAAHAQGLVHRDIKPANVLLENSVQRVKITDFGLAGAAAAGLKGGEPIAGTPLYMSPEQARGAPTDQRSDLFSLGSVLYTLCAGRAPFRADTTAAVLKLVSADAHPPLREIKPDVPAWLGEVIARLMAREACDRFASAQEVAELLGKQLALLQQPPLAPHPVTPTAEEQAVPRPLAGPPARRRRLVLVACLIALLAVLAALAAFLKPWQRPAPEPRPGGNGQPDDAPRPKAAGPAETLGLRRADIPPRLLALAGGGDPKQAPEELAAVLGDGRFLLPQANSLNWMDQSPDGRLLAVPFDKDVVLFAAQTGEYLRSLQGPGGRVVCVTFSRDSRLLAATASYEEMRGAVRVWDLQAGQELYTNPVPDPRISGAAVFSADGKGLLVAGWKRIHVWDARTGKPVQILDGQAGGLAKLNFSPDGRRLAGADWDGRRVQVFDWDGEKLAEFRSLDGHRAPVATVVYSPDGKYLASGDEQAFKLWNAETLDEIRTVETPAYQLAFTPDSRTLLAATTNSKPRAVHTFTRWSLDTQEKLRPLSVEVSAIPDRAFHCLGRGGKVLFVGREHNANYVQAIDSATGKELFPRRGHDGPLHAVAVGPNGRVVASAGEDRVVLLWDLATGRILHSLKAHAATTCGLAFSPDSRLLASGSRDGMIVLWDVATGSEVRTLRGEADSFSRIQFSPDGRLLAAGSNGGLVKIWDTSTGKVRDPLPGHTGVVRCVAFSPDGRWLASGGEDRTVLLHPLAEGSSRTFKAPGAVHDVGFAPDGRTLAAVGTGPNAAVRLWNLDSGQETTWPGHAGPVQGLAFSPAVSLLATCGEDGTVRLWDRITGEVRPWTIGPGPFGGPVRAVAFTPDGRYLLTANANGTVYVLRVGTPGERSQGSTNP